MNTFAEKESKVGVLASWATLLGSFILSFATWVVLARLAGFERHTVWAMPFSVDGYIVMALVAWTRPVSEKVAKFARKNTYFGAFVGVSAQSAYHATVTYNTHGAWMAVLAGVVGALPPGLAAGAVHMRALVRRSALDRMIAEAPLTTVASVETPTPIVEPEPVPEITATNNEDLDITQEFEFVSDDTATDDSDATRGTQGDSGNWDKDLAKKLLAAATRAEVVAAQVGTSKRTIERWRKRWIAEGAL